MSSPRLTFLTLFLVCFTAGRSSLVCFAQVPPSRGEGLYPKSSDTFSQAIVRLANERNIVIIAEDQPFREGLLVEKNLKPLASDAPTEEIVKVFAQAYDYEAEQKGRIFLFRKRFTYDGDLPCVTLSECVATARDAARITSRFTPNVSHTSQNNPGEVSLWENIRDTFSQAQLDALHNGSVERGATSFGKPVVGKTPQADGMVQIGVPVSSLSAPLRGLVWNVATQFYLQDHLEWLPVSLRRLNTVTTQDVLFVEKINGGGSVFGYEIVTANQQKRHVPLTGYDISGGILLPEEFTDDENAPTFTVQTQNSGKPVPDYPPVFSSPSSFNATTIANWIKIVSSHAQNTLLADDDLGDKRITIAGDSGDEPSQIFRAIADLYGLRVLADTKGNLRLTRPRLPAPEDPTQLPESLRTIIPPPLLRAYVRDAERSAKFQMDTKGVPQSNQKQSIVYVATQGLRMLTEVQMRKSINGHIALSKLSSEEHNLLGLVLLDQAMPGLVYIASKPVPSYITKFDDLILTGGISDAPNGEKRFSLFLSHYEGKSLVQGVGFGNLRAPNTSFKSHQ